MIFCHPHPLVHPNTLLHLQTHDLFICQLLSEAFLNSSIRLLHSNKFVWLKENKRPLQEVKQKVIVIRLVDLKDHSGCYGEQEQIQRGHLGASVG